MHAAVCGTFRASRPAKTGAPGGGLRSGVAVAAADTVMNRPSRELTAEVYPSVPYRPTAGDFDTLLSIQKARRLLGYEPQWQGATTSPEPRS
jgi:hypothetical protein